MEKQYLCFIKYVGTDNNSLNTYDLLFSNNADEFWGENFEYMPCCLCNELIPLNESYNVVKQVKMPFNLSLVQDSCCFSYQDAIDGIISIAYAYDEQDKLVFNFKFGDEYTDVMSSLTNNKNVTLCN